MTQATLQTDRIRLVPLSDDHLELEAELDSDPEVMRYLTGSGRTRTQVEAAPQMRIVTAEPVPGLGFWVGFVGEQFVGWWLLEPAGCCDDAGVTGPGQPYIRTFHDHCMDGPADIELGGVESAITKDEWRAALLKPDTQSPRRADPLACGQVSTSNHERIP